jgi:hypothetical protein
MRRAMPCIQQSATSVELEDTTGSEPEIAGNALSALTLSSAENGKPTIAKLCDGPRIAAYPAFSNSMGSVRLCFFTISAVMERSLTFLLPGT